MVASNAGGRDTMAIFRFDPETRQFGEVLAQHPKFDVGADVQGDKVGDVITEPETDRVLGFIVNAERPQTVWIDEGGAYPGDHRPGAAGPEEYLRRFPNSSRVLISSYPTSARTGSTSSTSRRRRSRSCSPASPGWSRIGWSRCDPSSSRPATAWRSPPTTSCPQLQAGRQAAHRRPCAWRADGACRHPGARLGYMEAEILAAHGYAVILPNFRVTPGFGAKIYQAGFGTIGRQMSEDHEDAVKWAVDQGITDPNRVCISGASYGGYAVLRALAKTPNLFKCGVAGLVVSDLEMQLRSTAGDTAYSESGVEFWKRLVGQNDANKTALRDNSPVHMARQIKAPVFMYAGAADIRTPPEQTKAMVSALERAGNPPKAVIMKSEEGHGFGRVENNVDVYNRMLEFLDENIGPKAH
jgi:dienelactone hydrolase